MKTTASLVWGLVTVSMLMAVPHQAQAASWESTFHVAHGAQGTGNYKGKRDRHEKPGPMKEKKRKRFGWIPKR